MLKLIPMALNEMLLLAQHWKVLGTAYMQWLLLVVEMILNGKYGKCQRSYECATWLAFQWSVFYAFIWNFCSSKDKTVVLFLFENFQMVKYRWKALNLARKWCLILQVIYTANMIIVLFTNLYFVHLWSHFCCWKKVNRM